MNATEARHVLELTEEDYEKAFVEVAFLVDAFASTIDNIMGGNTAPVGRIAGRDTAKKLPVHLPDPSLETVLEVLGKKMGAGFEFALEEGDLVFRKCIVRDLCATRGIPTGGAVCRLFHAYFDGIVNGLLHRPVKSTLVTVGEECRTQTRVQ